MSIVLEPTITLDPGRYVQCRIEWPAVEGQAPVALCRCQGKWEMYSLDVATGLEIFLRYAYPDEAATLDAKHEQVRRDLFSQKS